MAEAALQRVYDDMVDAVYRAAAAPHDWREVMDLMRRAFRRTRRPSTCSNAADAGCARSASTGCSRPG